MTTPAQPSTQPAPMADYWDLPDPVAATIVNIAGQRRREALYRILTGAEEEWSPGWQHMLRVPFLTSTDRRRLIALHPTWLGGEELPPYLPGEIEIARIIVSTVTLDVISLRARRQERGTLRPRSTWHYRLVDEHGVRWVVTPESSAATLSLNAVVAMIDGAAGESYPRDDKSLLNRIRSSMGADVGEAFLTVESVHYPELTDHFARQAREWADARREEEITGGESDDA